MAAGESCGGPSGTAVPPFDSALDSASDMLKIRCGRCADPAPPHGAAGEGKFGGQTPLFMSIMAMFNTNRCLHLFYFVFS